MGSSERYSLRWDDFGSNLCTAFKSLRSAQNPFFDVYLAAEDGELILGSHRALLSAVSPLFQTMMTAAGNVRSGANASQFIYLHGISGQNLSHVVNFVYEGEVDVALTELDSFLAAAGWLQIKGLMKRGQQKEQGQEEQQQLQHCHPQQRTRSKRLKSTKRSGGSVSGHPPAKIKPGPLPDDDEDEEEDDGDENDDDIQKVARIKVEAPESDLGAPASSLEVTEDNADSKEYENDNPREDSDNPGDEGEDPSYGLEQPVMVTKGEISTFQDYSAQRKYQ